MMLKIQVCFTGINYKKNKNNYIIKKYILLNLFYISIILQKITVVFCILIK